MKTTIAQDKRAQQRKGLEAFKLWLPQFEGVVPTKDIEDTKNRFTIFIPPIVEHYKPLWNLCFIFGLTVSYHLSMDIFSRKYHVHTPGDNDYGVITSFNEFEDSLIEVA